ncbi:MAG: hypothetical protein FWC13_10390 [Oscillospiraceae bacterium]|nr:hypothetical protein [Oscillospiraceae bacterium]
MNTFLWIFRHYFKKNLLSPTNLLVIGLPLVFLTAFTLIDMFVYDVAGGQYVIFSGIAIPLVLGFQFFGADLTADWLHGDLKTSTRQRLLVSPIDQRVFFTGIMTAGWLTNVLYGGVVVAVTALVFDVAWGNFGVVLAVMLCISLITQLVGAIIFYFTKDEKSGNRLTYLFGEIMIGISLLPIVAGNIFSPGGALEAIFDHLPVSLGTQVVEGNNMALGFGVLILINAILAAVVLLVGRRRNDGI